MSTIDKLITEETNAVKNDVKFEVVKDASSLTITNIGSLTHPQVHLSLGEYSHTFSATSRISTYLKLHTHEELQNRMRHGAYFFLEGIDGNLHLNNFVDDNTRFIHSDANIKELLTHLGVTYLNDNTRKKAKGLHRNSQDSSLYTGRCFDNFAFNLDTLSGIVEGGSFHTLLRFLWSPFDQNVSSHFELVRDVCQNGVIMSNSFLNAKIPLYNMWYDNLLISSNQIKSVVDSRVTSRLEQINQERASVADVILANDHINTRIEGLENPQESTRLHSLSYVTDVYEHLADFYEPQVFKNANIADQLDSHLTKFDLWNVCSELRSHTTPIEGSSNKALDMMCQDLLFRTKKYKVKVNIPNPFKSKDHAFFGDVTDEGV
jgi:hypothetical protein